MNSERKSPPPGLPGEKIKLRLASYEFIIPRAQRYELHVPLKLAESVAQAASWPRA